MEFSDQADRPPDMPPPLPDADPDLAEVDRGAAVVSTPRADARSGNGKTVWGASKPSGAVYDASATAQERVAWGHEPLPSQREQAAREQKQAAEQPPQAASLGSLTINRPAAGAESANGSTAQAEADQQKSGDASAAVTGKNGKPGTDSPASPQRDNMASAGSGDRSAARDSTPDDESPVGHEATGTGAESVEATSDEPEATAGGTAAAAETTDDTSTGSNEGDLRHDDIASPGPPEAHNDDAPVLAAAAHDVAGAEQAAPTDVRDAEESASAGHDLQGTAAEDSDLETEDEIEASGAVEEGELVEGPADAVQASDREASAEPVDLEEIEVDGQKILVPVGEGQAGTDRGREQAGGEAGGSGTGSAGQEQPQQQTSTAEELAQLREQLAADPDNQEALRRMEELHEAGATLDGQPIEAKLVDAEPQADSQDGAADQPQDPGGPEDLTRNPYAEKRSDALENEVDKALLTLLDIEDNPARLPELERDESWGPKLEQARVKLREVISKATEEYNRRTAETPDAEPASDETSAGADAYAPPRESGYTGYESFEQDWEETLRRFREATAGMADMEDVFGFDKTTYDWKERPPDPLFSEEDPATEGLSPEDQAALDAYLAGYPTPEARQAAAERFETMSQEAKDVILEVGRKLLVEEPTPDSQTPQDPTADSPNGAAEAAPPTAAERLDAVLAQISDPETRAKFDQIRSVINSLSENGKNTLISAAEKLLKIEQRDEEIRNSPLPRTPTAWDYVERGLPVPPDLAHGLTPSESTKVRVGKGLLGLFAGLFVVPTAALTQSMDAKVVGGNVKQGFTVRINNGSRSATMTVRAGSEGEAANVALASSDIISHFIKRMRAASRLN